MDNRKYSICFNHSPYNADWLNVIEIILCFFDFIIFDKNKLYLNYTNFRLFFIKNLMAALGGVL